MRIDYSSIEENKETVDKKDIEEFETQISIECIKVYKYLLEIETFEVDGTVNEVKKWVKCLEQKEKAAAKQVSTTTINKFTVKQGTKVIGEKLHLL